MILYVYIPLLESELEDLKLAYNAHKIRTQKGKLRPDGIPDDMYYFQERFGKAFFILILIPWDFDFHNEHWTWPIYWQTITDCLT